MERSKCTFRVIFKWDSDVSWPQGLSSAHLLRLHSLAFSCRLVLLSSSVPSPPPAGIATTTTVSHPPPLLPLFNTTSVFAAKVVVVAKAVVAGDGGCWLMCRTPTEKGIGIL